MSLKRRRVFNYLSLLPKLLTYSFTTLYSRYPKLEDYVIGSGISSFDRYVSISSGASLTAILAAFLSFCVFTYYSSNSILLSLLSGVVVSLSVVFPLCYVISLGVVFLKYKSRREVMEARFPLLASLMSLVATSEKDLSRVFEVLNQSYSEVLKDFRVELEMITSLIKLNYPTNEALARVAKITPSPTLREVLLGLSASVVIGAEPLELMSTVTNKYLERYSLKVERAVNELGVMLEIYLAIALLTPVVVGSLGTLLVLNPVGGISFELVVFILSYLIVPASSIASMVLIDATVSKVMI
ncbi:MAG: type II secretion system F family protein [Zestosphaera sp.]